MSINSASVLVDGTVATTGGTATDLLLKNQSGLEVVTILDDSSEFILNKKITFSVKEPKVSAGAPNGYTQQRCNAVLQVPRILDNGNRTVDTLRIELACDHETSDAEIQSMLVTGAQLLHRADFSAFWKQQVLS